MIWTDERTDMLRQGWEAGLSGRSIAAQLGSEKYRSAVLGKARRLKLPARRVDLTPRHKSRKPAGAHPSTWVRTQSDNPFRRTSAPDVPLPVAVQPQLAPEPIGLTLMDLPFLGACRWPLWGHLEKPDVCTSLYCGAACDPSESYCRAHATIGATKPSEVSA